MTAGVSTVAKEFFAIVPGLAKPVYGNPQGDLTQFVYPTPIGCDLARESMLSTPRYKLLDARDTDLRVQLEEDASNADSPLQVSSVSSCHGEALKPTLFNWREEETTLADEIGATLNELEECGKRTATQLPNKRYTLLDAGEAPSANAEVSGLFETREQAVVAELEDLKYQTAEIDSLIDNIRRWREVRRQESASLELRLLQQFEAEKETVTVATHNGELRNDVKDSVETVSERTAESLEMARKKRVRLTQMLDGNVSGRGQQPKHTLPPQRVRSPVADVILTETISEITSLENGLAALREVLKRDTKVTPGIQVPFPDAIG